MARSVGWILAILAILTLRAGSTFLVAPAAAQMRLVENADAARHVDPRWGFELRLPQPNRVCDIYDLTVRRTFVIFGTASTCRRDATSLDPPDGAVVLELVPGYEPTADVDRMAAEFADLGHVPPIRREIARRWCARAVPRVEARFRELGRVAGLPAFECRGSSWRDDLPTGTWIAVTLFRGTRQAGDPPYPRYRYRLSLTIPRGREEEAERLLANVLADMRLLPLR